VDKNGAIQWKATGPAESAELFELFGLIEKFVQ